MSATIHILGILSLLQAAATQQELIQIFHGAGDEREINNASIITVTSSDIIRLKFVAITPAVLDMRIDMTNMTTTFRQKYHEITTTALINEHYLQVTESGSMTVDGLLESTHNTDYKVIVYFTVQSEPSTEAQSTTAAPTEREPSTTFTTTQDKETTPPIADTASSTSEAQVKSSTFIAVVVVVVVVALIGYTVTMAAVVIYYRNKLRAQVHVSEELQQQSGAEHDTSIAPIAPVAPV